MVVIITWNTDQTDVDLHVTDPSGETCFYGRRQTAQGGTITPDVTQGYGPEMFVLARAAKGLYDVRARYFANHADLASARTKVYATIYQGWGTPQEKTWRKTVVLERGQVERAIAAIQVE